MDWSKRIGQRIKLRDLHILLSVTQCGSLTKAAEELAISKPVVSKVIADLEQLLGVRLLDRGRHGAEPTIYGMALLKHGTAAFDELKQGVQEIEFLNDPTVGELRIGSTDAMAGGILPIIMSRLHRRRPRLNFHVMQESGVAPLYRALRERSVDLILGRLAMPIAEEDLSAETLFDDPLLLVAGSRNPWRQRRRISLANLVHDLWILPPPETVAGAIVKETFQACGLEVPRGSIISVNVQMHNSLLASGPYLAMRPTSMLRFGPKYPLVKVLPVKLPRFPGPVGVITLKHRTISPVARLFIDCAREVAMPLAG